MAEVPEENGTQQVLDATDPNKPIPIPDSYPQLGALPDAYSVYKNIVGNPYSGSEPLTKKQGKLDNSDYIKSLEDYTQKKSTIPQDNPYYSMRPYTYNGDFDGANFERYYNTPAYKQLGFSPYRDNEALYNNKLTLGDQFVRAAHEWPTLVKTGFMSGVKSWGTMFTDPLAPDVESAREMQRAMATGNFGGHGVGAFLGNTFLNTGYTIGIGLDMAAETLVLAGATVLAGGADAEATVPAWLTRIGMGAKKIAQGAEIAEAAENAIKIPKTVAEAKSFWSTVGDKALGIINPLENTTKALKSTEYATNYAKQVRTIGAFAEDMIATHAAVSEAKLEGGMVKIDLTRDLIDQYRSSHDGKDPEGEELQKIENIATQESVKTGLWNLPAIMWSNKFMYETMLAPLKKLIKPNSVKLPSSTSIAFENGVFKPVENNLVNKVKVAGKERLTPKFYGTWGMSYLKANLAEGVQENLQEAISSGATKEGEAIYKDQGKGAYEGYMSYFMKGLGEQFSAQGGETFAGGFIMGMFAQPIMTAPTWSMGKVLDATVNRDQVSKYKAQQDESIKKDVDALNNLYQNTHNVFAPDINNAVKQGHLSNDLYEAASEGKQKEAVDAKDNSSFEHIYTALRTGHYDVFINKLKDMKNLSPEELKDAYKDLGVVDGANAASHMDQVIRRAEQIKSNYEEIANQFPNPHEPSQFKKGTEPWLNTILGYHAWEDAKKQLIYASTSYTTHTERMNNLASTLTKLGTNITKNDIFALTSLLEPKTTQAEIATLKSEISVLTEPNQSRERKEKERQLEHLEAFHLAILDHNEPALKKDTNDLLGIHDEELNKEYDSTDKVAKKAFVKYLQYLAKRNDNIPFSTDIDNAYTIVKDHARLKGERQSLVKSLNMLSNPKGFLHLQNRLQKMYSKLHEDMPNILQENSRVFSANKHLGYAIQLLNMKDGVNITPEFAKELGEAIKNNKTIGNPKSFVDSQTKEILTEGEKYDKALDSWSKYKELIQTTPTEEEIETKEEELPETNTSSTFDPKRLGTFPEDLKSRLQKISDDISREVGAQPETLEEQIKYSPNVFNEEPEYINAINDYFNKSGETEVIPTPVPEVVPEIISNEGVEEFNKKSIPDKWKEIYSDLKEGTLNGRLDNTYPDKEEPYQIILNDGRAIRTFLSNKQEPLVKPGDPVTIERSVWNGDPAITVRFIDSKEYTWLRKNLKVNEILRQEAKNGVTLQDINNNINPDNLKIAMERNYEVQYRSKDIPDMRTYLIKSVGDSTVTLTRAGTDDAKIVLDSIKTNPNIVFEVVIPGEVKSGEDTPKIIDTNEKVIKESVPNITKKPLKEAEDDFDNIIC